MIEDKELFKLFTYYNLKDYTLKIDKKGYYYLIYNVTKHVICYTKNSETMAKAIHLIGGNISDDQ